MNDRRHIPCSRPPRPIRGGVIAFAACLLIPVSLLAGEITESFKTRIEGDWAAQEKRLGRRPEQPDAIRAALGRADKLLADLQASSRPKQLESDAAALRRFRARSRDARSLDASARGALYHEVRWVTRELALKNPLVTHQPIAFMKRNRFVCQMLHEYLGYFYDYGDVAPGGGVFVLELVQDAGFASDACRRLRSMAGADATTNASGSTASSRGSSRVAAFPTT